MTISLFISPAVGRMVVMGQIAEDDMNTVNVTPHMTKVLLTIDTREIAI